MDEQEGFHTPSAKYPSLDSMDKLSMRRRLDMKINRIRLIIIILVPAGVWLVWSVVPGMATPMGQARLDTAKI